MKLQILIPRYNESEEILKPLLDSILIQQRIDFSEIGIIICDDGSKERLSDSFLNFYREKIKMEVHYDFHRGISGARNALISYASSDYIMFCDADDMFYTVTALWLILSGMKAQFDVMIADFLEEGFDPEDESYTYLTHTLELMYIHGKVYRRQFLLDESIWFPEEITLHEEHFFNSLCFTFSNNVRHCEVPLYLWKWRSGSITTSDKKFNQISYPELIRCKCALIDELVARGAQNNAMDCAGSFVYDVFYTINSEEWLLPENQEYKKNVERLFMESFPNYEDLWNSLANERKLIIASEVKKHTPRCCINDVDCWLNNLRSLKIQNGSLNGGDSNDI